MIRVFKKVSDEHRKFKNIDINLPIRGTKKSAGYDFFSNEDIEILPNQKHLFWTDVKSYMQDDEVLKIYVRSSIGIKKGLILANTVGIIDSDYYENSSNDGNIGICLYNTTSQNVKIEKGEKIAQGIFSKYLIVDDDDNQTERTGGIGHTGK
jgi:dUTP pyrophosphatase